MYISGEEHDKSGRAEAGPYPNFRINQTICREEKTGWDDISQPIALFCHFKQLFKKEVHLY